jgi:predicted DNA-binding transcriptional regulator YafY
MNQGFLRQRFVGHRFDEHSPPPDTLKDFAALETRSVEIVKRRYIAVNPVWVRSPILRIGADVEVLEPPELRRDVHKAVLAIAGRYV